MCNACGFYCCGSDQFAGCGCEHCGCAECLSDDEFEADEDDGEFWCMEIEDEPNDPSTKGKP